MKKKKSVVKDKEKIILLTLHRDGGFMTAHEISQKSGISYVTARKYLKKLLKEGILIEGTK